MPDDPLRPLGGGTLRRDASAGTHIAYVQKRSEMARLLAFAGRSIDDVVNNPMAKRDMVVWFKTAKQVARRLEIRELERQWNPMR